MELLYFLGITVVAFSIPLIALKLGKEWLISLLPIYLITGNVFAESFLMVVGIQTSLAVPIYSATFLITDLLSEHYYKSDARRAVFVGLMGQILFVAAMLTISNAPIMKEKLDAYQATFAFLPRLVLGSFVAYLISQTIDISIYHAIMRKTGKDRWLFVRNNVSTATSQFVDTAIFLSIAFYGRPPFETVGKLAGFVVTTWLFKVAVAICDTPYLYLSRRICRRG